MLDETLTDELLCLLTVEVPQGEYLVEHREGVRLLWRISDGAPPDGSEEPAGAWMLLRPR